ncbi:hypothetical protein COCNU_02G001730 [Cocos nucifera]|uniref:Uncharacterized protein n=1 Tax=Cocos nucifera TaxID=13894 RepID=A0A8K0HXZ8_COCNU|nr:hypothetical protein COCNU_02G001730 [Cocos nucifera]
MIPVMFAMGFLLCPFTLCVPPTRNLPQFLLELHTVLRTTFHHFQLEFAYLLNSIGRHA